MSLNWVFVIVLACIGMALTNPLHDQHHAALSPIFMDYLQSAHGKDLEGADAAWTFLPKRLDYRNYYLLSTTEFPGAVAQSGTPAAGTLTLGILGQVFVLFPNGT